jgi:hypothetical protein
MKLIGKFLIILVLFSLAGGGLNPILPATSVNSFTEDPILSTDSSLYLPGATATITGTGFPMGTSVALSLLNPTGLICWFDQHAPLKGSFTSTVPISPDWPPGTYTVRAVFGTPATTVTCTFSLVKTLPPQSQTTSCPEISGIPVCGIEPNQSVSQEVIFSLEGGWNMLSLPLLTDPDPKVVFSGLPTWRLYTWDAANRQYLDKNHSQLSLGKGFWLWVPSSTNYVVVGEKLESGVFQIPLYPGWNLIGNPYCQDIPWGAVSVNKDGSAPLTLTAAISSGWLRSSIWYWSEGAYHLLTAADDFQELKGYWIYAKTTGLTLTFNLSYLAITQVSVSPTNDISAWNPVNIEATCSETANWTINFYRENTMVSSVSLPQAEHLLTQWAPPSSYQIVGEHRVQILASSPYSGSAEYNSSLFLYNFPLKITEVEFLNQLGMPITTIQKNQQFIVKVSVKNWWSGPGAFSVSRAFVPIQIIQDEKIWFSFVLFFDLLPGQEASGSASCTLPDAGSWTLRTTAWKAANDSPQAEPYDMTITVVP